MAIKEQVEEITNPFGIEMGVMKDVSEYEKYSIHELDAGVTFYGRLQPRIFKNEEEGKNYDNLALNIVDDDAEEVLRIYCNIPKNKSENISRGSNFYRTTFDLIYSYMYLQDPLLVVDEKGEEKNYVKNNLNWEEFVAFLEGKNAEIKVTEGNRDSDYKSFIIIKME